MNQGTINQPSKFEPTAAELEAAAKCLAQHISPKYVLKNPETGDILARGEKTSKTDMQVVTEEN